MKQFYGMNPRSGSILFSQGWWKLYRGLLIHPSPALQDENRLKIKYFHMKHLLINYFIIGSITLCGCKVNDRYEKISKALKKSDYIMNNIDNPEVVQEFPQKYFPPEKINEILSGLTVNCDWKNRKGKFVDYRTMMIHDKFQVAYIYEYILKCDSIRFILLFGFEDKNPELIQLTMEQLRKQNKLITDPSKQLIPPK